MSNNGTSAAAIWAFSVLVAALGTVTASLIWLYTHTDQRNDQQDAWIRRSCLQLRILDDWYCQRIQEAEMRELGAIKSRCPLYRQNFHTYSCPEMPMLSGGEVPE